MPDSLLHQIALTLVPHIGDVHTKSLISHFGTAEAIFRARKKELEHVEGIGSVRAKCIRDFRDFSLAENEMSFIGKYKITPLFITTPGYPKRLLNCYDSPAILYYRGNADLNSARIISVVGTRTNSEYGRLITEKLMEELSALNILVVSGLAFGIDTIAHKAALKNGLNTVGVLAHGLDRIYPPQNKTLARQMTGQGGLLTDFRNDTRPDKQNFPRRNRIVAGLCDALMVIESGVKGGSMITAEIANGYNRDVFAVPGRINDVHSEGCNELVRNNKAVLITGARDLLLDLGWTEEKKPVKKLQRQLFVELSPEEKIIADILTTRETVHIDDLYQKSGLSNSGVASALLTLEMQNLVQSLPGKMYRLC